MINNREIEKIIKIAEKYKDSLSKQQKQEQSAIEMLELQEQELNGLHEESKQLADELR